MTPTVNEPSEATYYARHMRLPGFTAATQDRLRQARVLVIGVGGLGCPAALYLAGAGVGTIGLCDADTVSATNLHRQVLFDVGCIGQKKVDAAMRRLSVVNPHVKFELFDQFADAASLAELVTRFDVVVDGTDNFSAKFAINDACAAAGRPLVYGSIFQFEGQVSVFHLATDDDPQGLSYRDLYPDAPPAALTQNCGEAGVIGVLPGIIGSLQANEVIKILTGIGEPLSGSMLVFDALDASTRQLRLRRRALGSLEAATSGAGATGEITAEELAADAASAPAGAGMLLIDVREPHEREAGSIGGLHIPLASLPSRLAEIPRHRGIVAYCKSGVRSAKAALYLRSVLEGCAIFSLAGGLDGAACVVAAQDNSAMAAA